MKLLDDRQTEKVVIGAAKGGGYAFCYKPLPSKQAGRVNCSLSARRSGFCKGSWTWGGGSLPSVPQPPLLPIFLKAHFKLIQKIAQRHICCHRRGHQVGWMWGASFPAFSLMPPPAQNPSHIRSTTTCSAKTKVPLLSFCSLCGEYNRRKGLHLITTDI